MRRERRENLKSRVKTQSKRGLGGSRGNENKMFVTFRAVMCDTVNIQLRLCANQLQN